MTDYQPGPAPEPDSRRTPPLQLPPAPPDVHQIIGTSTLISQLNDKITRVARTHCTVLISGESGTGKELVARAVHRGSAVHAGPCIPVNVAAIPEGLVESYLFGHIKGAFTGANQPRDGAFRRASHGTLFLDEIGEMPLQTQSRLLRVLEDKVVIPVGSDIPVQVNARIIAATNRNLKAMVEQGSFRADLWYRLNVFSLHTPPLREHPGDIPALVTHILAQLHSTLEKPLIRVDRTAMRYLMQQPWQGNVRELRNLLERAAVLCDDTLIQLKDLLLEPEPADTHASPVEIQPLSIAVDAFKARHIMAALQHTGGCRERASQVLGLSPSTLYRQMNRLGLKDPQE